MRVHRNSIGFAALMGLFALLMAIPLVASPIDRWHERTPIPGDPHLSDITYGNGVFVVVGSTATNGLVAVSRDGRQWSTQSTPLHLATVTFGDGLFVALQTRGANGVYRGLASPDGFNWIEMPLAPNDTMVFSFSPDDVVFGADRFIVAGSYRHYHNGPGGGHQPEAHTYLGYSFDGYVWNDNSLADIASPFSWKAITYGRGAFVITDTQRLLTSTNDGQGWMVATNAALVLRSVFFGGDKFLAGTDHHHPVTNKTSLVYISTNAIDWTAHGISNRLLSVTMGAGQFAAVDEAIIWTSQNAVTWTQKHEHPSDRFSSIAYGAGTFVAVGERGTVVQSDPAVPVLGIRAAGTNLQLEVFGEAGAYELLRSANLQAWSNAGSFTNPASPTVLEVPRAEGPLFYRAILLPNP